MTHVSKKKISKETEGKIVNAFLDSMLHASPKRGRARMYAILTPTERIMFAKRLAIITMLDRGSSYYDIETTLNVSGSTIQRLDARLGRGDFDPLCRIFNRNLSFLDYLELFMSAGLPSIAGPRGQKRLDALRSGRKLRERL